MYLESYGSFHQGIYEDIEVIEMVFMGLLRFREDLIGNIWVS